MKKINKYILSGALCTLCISNGFARAEGNAEPMDIRSNWYIEIGAGAQLLFSADASKLDFG